MTSETSTARASRDRGSRPEAPAPAAVRRRLPALDVLRGIAILGTLLTNIWIFSGVTTQMGDADLAAAGLRSVPEQIFDTALSLTTDGKYIGLLTIMFGIGLEIQRQSAIRKGESWPGAYPWRAALLILDGLLNYVFIFEFDVLMGYGLTGLVVAFVMAGSPRAQKIWMGVGVALHLAHLSLMQLPLLFMNVLDPTGTRVAEVMDRYADDPASAREVLAGMGEEYAAGYDEVSTLDAAGEGAWGTAGTGSYWGQVSDRVENFWWGRGEIPVMFTMGLGLFLVGAHLYRAGLFRPEGGRLRRWVMGLGFGVGVPLDIAARLVFPDLGAGFARYGTSTIVAFGLLAAVAAFYAHGRTPGWLGTPLSYVGRMALTFNLAQNLLASILFYDWGLGLANRTAHLNSTLVTMGGYAVIATILVVFSVVWLRRFPRGPVEWAWHASYEWIAARTEPGRIRRGERRAGRRAERRAERQARRELAGVQ